MTPEKNTRFDRRRILVHLVLPLIAPAAIVCLYFTPKAVFGCANRGLMALAVALLATIVAAATTVKGLKERSRGEKEAAIWWTITALILLLPIVLLAGPLG